MLDVNDVRRKAAKLVPRDDVRRGARGELFRIEPGQRLVRDVTKTDAMAVAEKTRFGGNTAADFCERFVAARGGDAIGLVEQRRFERFGPAAPFGDFEARAELGIGVVKRMGEQARQKRSAAGAFDELRRAQQHAEHDAHERGIGNAAGGDVDEKFRAVHDARRAGRIVRRWWRSIASSRCAWPSSWTRSARRFSAVNWRKKASSPAASVAAEKPVAFGPWLKGEFAEGIIGLKPVFGGVAEKADERWRGAAGKITFAVAFQSLARLLDHRRRQGGFGRQVREKIIGQIHFGAEDGGNSSSLDWMVW